MPGELRFELNPELTPQLMDQVIEIWRAVGDAGGAVGVPQPTTRADVEVLSSPAFERVRNGTDRIVVTFAGDEPVGFGFMCGGRGPLFAHWETIKRLQVHPDRQGEGIGGRMLEAIHAYAKELGLEQLHLTVRAGTGREAWYERFGYELVATIPGIIRVAPGDDRDELYLIKRL